MALEDAPLPNSTPDSGQVSSTPTTITPTPATSGAPAQAATQPNTQAPATGAEAMVPSYRLREAREAAERQARESFAAKEADYKSQLERIQSQLHALVGVQPQANQEVDQVRAQFAKLYPGLSQMEQRSQELLAVVERAQDLETQNQHYWTTYGRQTMDRLFEHASKDLGSPLTEEGKRQLHQSFVGFVQSSPEMQNRYSSDPSIVEDFWKAFTSSFIDPVRRGATVQVQARVPQNLPQDTPGGVPNPAAPPKLSGIDDRVNAAWAQYNQHGKP